MQQPATINIFCFARNFLHRRRRGQAGERWGGGRTDMGGVLGGAWLAFLPWPTDPTGAPYWSGRAKQTPLKCTAGTVAGFPLVECACKVCFCFVFHPIFFNFTSAWGPQVLVHGSVI